MMDLQKKNDSFITDSIMFLITLAWALTAVLFEAASGSKYAFFIITLIAYAVVAFYYRGSLPLLIDEFTLSILCFTVFTLISSIWAINRLEPIQKTTTLFLILGSLYPIYTYCSENKKTKLLLSSIKWAGYIIAIYTIAFYGYNNMIIAAQSQFNRLNNEFANINTLSLTIVLSCIIELWDLMHKRGLYEVLFFIPCCIVLFAAQTRKAFVFLVLGLLYLTILKDSSCNAIKNVSVYRKLIWIICIILSIYIISQSNAFHGIFERMEGMIYSVTGQGKADSSALNRQQLVKIGLDIWKTAPFFGIGIGCSHIIVYQRLGLDYYIHNNFVEILSSGGIIGLFLYYWIHGFIFKRLVRNYNRHTELFAILFSWILLIIIMDYGMVSYYSKKQWLYIMTLCIGVREMQESGIDEAADKENNSIYIK